MQRILSVLVMLMIIFTLALSSSKATEKSKVKKEKAKTSQQKQTQMKKEPVEIYDLNPFDLSRTTLLPNYMGHDLKSIYEALSLLKINETAEKDEYETTEQHKQRIQDLGHKPLISTLTVNGIFSFVIHNNGYVTIYDADSQTLTLRVFATDSLTHGKEYDSSRVGLEGPLLFYNRSTYKAKNAYGGGSTTVEIIRRDMVVLSFSNKSALPLWDKKYTYDLITLNLESITPETAKAIRENLCIAFIYQLEEPYFLERSVRRWPPTRYEPYDYSYNYNNVLASVKEIWVFNKTNGEILLKVKTED